MKFKSIQNMVCLGWNLKSIYSSKQLNISQFTKQNASSCEPCTFTRFGTLFTLKICYDKAGNLPNKGRNFNTQTWGKIVYFLFV